MSWGSPTFVIAIIMICMGGWMINNWIRARHGYPIEDDNGNLIERKDPAADRKIELLTNENEGLNDKIGHLEERIAVLERIATDKSSRLSDEIENLR